MFERDTALHFGLMFAIAAVFGFKVSTASNIMLEVAQVEYFTASGGKLTDWDWPDTVTDLVGGQLGAVAGELIHVRKHDKRKRWNHCKEASQFPGFYFCTDDSTGAQWNE